MRTCDNIAEAILTRAEVCWSFGALSSMGQPALRATRIPKMMARNTTMPLSGTIPLSRFRERGDGTDNSTDFALGLVNSIRHIFCFSSSLQVGDWTQELFRLGLEQPRLPLWITAAQPSIMEKSIYFDNGRGGRANLAIVEGIFISTNLLGWTFSHSVRRGCTSPPR